VDGREVSAATMIVVGQAMASLIAAPALAAATGTEEALASFLLT